MKHKTPFARWIDRRVSVETWMRLSTPFAFVVVTGLILLGYLIR